MALCKVLLRCRGQRHLVLCRVLLLLVLCRDRHPWARYRVHLPRSLCCVQTNGKLHSQPAMLSSMPGRPWKSRVERWHAIWLVPAGRLQQPDRAEVLTQHKRVRSLWPQPGGGSNVQIAKRNWLHAAGPQT